MLFTERMNEAAETKQEFPRLRSVARIARIPVIDSTWQYASGFYTKIKGTNALIGWSLGTAESSVQAALMRTLPIVNVFEKPLGLVDSLLCKSLDLVEERVPVVTLPPELILVSTKEYVSNTIVQPVLKRADSLKQFGLDQATHVLDTKYATFAADQLDSALDVVDKYVDQYLPDSSGQGEPPDDDVPAMNDRGSSKAVQTIHHVDRFSRKLQRRLTQRTLMEAKAFKQGGEDTLQSLLFIAELFARDPKAVYDKGLRLWASLSQDEPENQTPPANLEQLTVMLTRETARRIVHLINYTHHGVIALPENISNKVHTLLMHCNHLADMLLKATRFEDAKFLVITQASSQVAKIRALLDEINAYTKQVLERVAGNIAGKPEPKKKLTENAINGSSSQQSSERNNLNSID